jgi:hypothetical protein
LDDPWTRTEDGTNSTSLFEHPEEETRTTNPEEPTQETFETFQTNEMTTAKSHTRKPDVFTGDRKKLEGFLRDCGIYIASNESDFANDAAKTQFILSHIAGGEAETWKENYFNTVIAKNPGTANWETPTELAANLRMNFSREDDVEESLRKLETLKQGSKTAEEIINEHRVLMARAKLSDSTLAVRMFR